MSARNLGIRARLIFSFLLVIVAPLTVSLVVLSLSLSEFIPQSEVVAAEDVQRGLEERFLPASLKALQLEAVYPLLARGDQDAIVAMLKPGWPVLAGKGDAAEIVRADGTVIFYMSSTGVTFGSAFRGTDRARGVPAVPPVPDLKGLTGQLDLGLKVPELGARYLVVPGLSFVDAGRAQWVWQIGAEKEGAVYGRYTFDIPGSMRPVKDISGQYTAIAVLAGILTFVIVAVLLSWSMSRRILVPLRRFAGAAESIASGNLDVPVSYKRPDEFGRLAAVLEDMRVRLRESLLGLQRADSERKQMVASVTHDLKTPLTSIRGYVEGLRDGVADNPAARDRYFAVILDKTTQLEGLIDGLFRISRLELSDAELCLQHVSARLLFTDLFARVRRDVEAAGLVFLVDEPLPERTVNADAGALAQVVDNIVQNAKRYSPPGGSIRASVVELASVLEVSISDNGAGISAEDLPHVFEMFYRGDRARSGNHGEAGLGLAICKRIVERHGGTITAANDHGALITFTLPLV